MHIFQTRRKKKKQRDTRTNQSDKWTQAIMKISVWFRTDQCKSPLILGKQDECPALEVLALLPQGCPLLGCYSGVPTQHCFYMNPHIPTVTAGILLCERMRKWWCISTCMCVYSVASVMSDSMTWWTVAHQAPLSTGFSRKEYWSGLSCPPPGDLPDPGIEPMSHVSWLGRRILYL